MRITNLVCILLGLLVGALAGENERQHDWQPRPVDFGIGYRNGKEYVYEYDSQLATGLNDQTQHAIQRFRAQMHLAFTSETTAVAQFKKMHAARFNDEGQMDVVKMISLQTLQTVELQKRHLELLEKPFEIRYEQGKVVELTFDKDDQTWSENVKRAAINHLQIQLDYDEPQLSFRTNETTIEGTCESVYAVVPKMPCTIVQNAHQPSYLDDRKDEGECVQVTKSVDFEKCQQRPDLRYNFYRGEILQRQDGVVTTARKQRVLDQSTIVQMELKRQEGDKHVLRFGRIVSQYAQPVTGDVSMVAVVVSELKLKSIKKTNSNSQIPEISNKKSAEPLAYSLEFDRLREDFMQNGNEEYLKAQPYLAERHMPEVIINIIKRLTQSFIADRSETQRLDWDGAQNFANLVKMIRYTSASELEEIEKQLDPKEAKKTNGMEWVQGSEELIKQILIDAYATAATQPSLKQVFDKISENEVSDLHMARAFEKLARSAPFVSQDLLQDTWSTCGKLQKGSQAQHSCILSYSRLGRAMCVRRSGKYDDDNQKNDKQSKIVGDEWVSHKSDDQNSSPYCSSSNVKQLFDDSKDVADQRLLALKAYGNLGLDTTIQKLEEILNDRQMDRMTRIAAIDAMRHLTVEIPIKIRRVLMPIFMDRFEFPEIRMNALHQILVSRPDKGTIDQIGTAMIRESNFEVRAFAANALRDAANAQQCRATARLFKLSSAEMNAQTQRAGSIWKAMSMPTMLGQGFVRVASLMGNDSRIPKEMMVALDLALNGHFVPTITQWGVQQQNIEDLFGRALEKMSERQGDAQIFVRRGKRSTTFERLVDTPVQSLKSMYERLRIVARRGYSAVAGSGYEDQPHLIVYKRENGMDTFYAVLDEQTLPAPFKDFLAKGQIDLTSAETGGTQSLGWTDATLMADQMVKIPTTVGLPLLCTMNVAKMSTVSGHWSLEIAGNSESVDEGRLSVRSLPKVSVRAVRQMEAYSPIHNTGIRILHTLDAQAPIEIKMTLNKEGLALDWQLPDAPSNGGPHRVLHLGSHPSTIYRAWPLKSRVFIEPEERTLFVPQIQSSFTPINNVVRCPLSGLRFEVRGHYHRNGGLNALMVGENVLDVHVHVDPSETAKTVRLTLHATSNSIERQLLTTSQHLKRIFDDETRQRTLFADSPSTEVSMLREKIERYEAHANVRYEIQARAQSLQNGMGDRRADYQMTMKARCNRETTVCSADAEIKAESPLMDKWAAHAVAHIARPTLTGVHGSIRSEHVIAHVETEWGKESASKKNILTACAYARPSSFRVRQWNSLVNARTEDRRSNSRDYADMDADEYDRMVLKQTPSSLAANRLTAVVEHQLTPETMETVRPYVEYAKSTYTPLRTWLTEMFVGQSPINGQKNDDEKLHSMLKFDLTAEDRSVRLQLNDVTRVHQMPAPWTLFGDNEEMHQESNNRMMFSNYQGSNSQSMNEQQAVGSGTGRRQSSQGFSQSQRFDFNQIGGGLKRGEAQCVLDSNFNVESFDGQRYKIPMSTCYTVLAKDCGSSSPKFAVLAKKQSEGNENLKIKLIVPSKSFVLYQEDKKMVVEADGTKLREDELEQYSIYKITETGRPIYVLHCQYTGMEVRFDGRQVLIKITDAYLNKQCGVCGHYNNDRQDTLRKNDNKIAGSLKEFHESYLYRGEEGSNECTTEALDKFREMKSEEYQQRSKFSRNGGGLIESDELVDEMERKNKKMIGSEEVKKGNKKQSGNSQESNENFGHDFVEPIPMTKVHEETHEICFSIQPVRLCPRGTQAIVEDIWTQRGNTEEEERDRLDQGKEFVCMERGARARSLMHQTQQQNVVGELRSMKSNKLIPVREAKKCARFQQDQEDSYYTLS
ncbi:Vit-6 [Aphelenchoides besseyi]|nr:Vit-6 [Aphelenchoides besseyi]